jgi:hypothetical protein
MLESEGDEAVADVLASSMRVLRFNWAFVGMMNWSRKEVVLSSRNWAKSSDCEFAGHSTVSPLRSWAITCCASMVD